MKDISEHKPQFTYKYVPFPRSHECDIVYAHGDKRMGILAKYLQKYYFKTDGSLHKIKTDAAARIGREIVIGDTNRYKSSLPEQEFSVECRDENLYFEGGHAAMVEKAVKWYMTLDRRAGNTAVMHGRDEDFHASVDLPEGHYDLVWFDEFDGNFFDQTRFMQRRHLPPRSEKLVVLRGEGPTLKVEDGQLKMTAIPYKDPNDPKITCAVPDTICSDETLWYAQGYAEIRAKVPMQHGAWPAWWTSSYCESTAGKTSHWTYLSEVDVFEVFGNETLVQPNIHKWYKNYAGTFTELYTENGDPLRHNGYADLHNGEYNGQKIGDVDKSGLHVPYKKYNMPPEEKDGYHVFGFLWTPDAMAMSVDGVEYMRFDLNDNFDNLTNMDDLKNLPVHMLFSNWIYTLGGWMANERNSILPEDFPVEFFVDYIRIYQKPGEGYLQDTGADREILF